MTESSPAVEMLDKLVRHWSSKREQDIVVRIEFTREDAEGCRVYRIESIQELTN